MSVDIAKQGPSSLKLAADAAGSAAQAAPPATQAQPSAAEAERNLGKDSLGVVFVHGMGQQHRAEILLEWSNPIVRSIADWTLAASTLESDGWNGDRVERSDAAEERSRG